MVFRRRKKDIYKDSIKNANISIFVKTENELRTTMKIARTGDTLVLLKKITLSKDFVIDKNVNIKFEGNDNGINTGGYELIFNTECNIY